MATEGPRISWYDCDQQGYMILSPGPSEALKAAGVRQPVLETKPRNPVQAPEEVVVVAVSPLWFPGKKKL